MRNEAKDLSGLFVYTHELPHIKRMQLPEEPDHYGFLRFIGIMIAAALSCLTFVYF